MASSNKRFAAGAVVGLGVAAAAAAGVGVQWPQAMAQDRTDLTRVSTAPIFAPPPGAPISFADIFDKVAPAVVSIDVTTHLTQSEMQSIPGFEGLPFGLQIPRQGGRGRGRGGAQGGTQGDDGPAAKGPEVQASGSGFFISADGYIVTNNHVVENADTIKVTLNDKRELTAKVVGRDEGTDLAVLKVPGSGFAYVDFENRAKPRVGDWILAVGNPFGFSTTATAGIVSAYGRSLNDSSSTFVDYIQIDAPINRGNSGGPTFDTYGRVIGVNTAIYSPSGGSVGIGFDIPADVADAITKQLISGGKIVRGYLGVGIQEITPEIAESLGLPANTGALVGEVTAGGPAERAGVQQGDVILTVNGHSITTRSEVTRQVAFAKAGEIIHLGLLRDGKHVNIDVRSGTRPSEEALAQTGQGGDDSETGPGGAEGPRGVRSGALGMSLAPLNAAARQRYALPATAHGVVIESLADSSDAAQKGVGKGDVIMRAGDRTVAQPADVIAAVAEARKAGRKAILLFVMHDGRSVFVPIKLDDTPKAK